MRCSIPNDWWQLSVVRRAGNREAGCSALPRPVGSPGGEVLIEGERDDVASTGPSSTSVNTDTSTGERRIVGVEAELEKDRVAVGRKG